MTLRILIAFLHLFTLGIGFYAIWTRADALKRWMDMKTIGHDCYHFNG